MPQDSSWPVQAALYARLCATPGVTSLLAQGADSVFDHVPQASVFPYIVLGDIASRPLETQEGGGHDITMDIRVFSRSPGMKEARGIMAAVGACLHDADFAVSGQSLVLCRLVSQRATLAADGETRAGVMTFRIITEPV